MHTLSFRWTGLVVFLLLAGPLLAEETWVGKQVFLKDGVKPRLKEEEVDPSVLGAFPATITGVDGKRLLFGEHWVYHNEVITLDQQAAVYVVRGWNKFLKKEYDAALADFEQAEKLDPKNASLYLNRGQTWRAKLNWPAAVKDFSELVRIAPKEGTGYYQRATVQWIQGNLDAAVDDFSKLIEIYPTQSKRLIDRGMALQDKGDMEGAIRDFTKAIELSPQSANAYAWRGRALRSSGKIDLALEDFSKAVELAPTDWERCLDRAAILRSQGDAKAADETFVKLIENRSAAITQNPNSALAYNNRAVALEAKRDYSAALQDYAKAIELDGSYAQPFASRAWLLATAAASEHRDGKQGIEDAKHACELTKWQNAPALRSLAAAYAETGDFDNAVKYQTQAFELLASAPPTNNPWEPIINRKRIEHFRSQKPYRF